MLDTHLRIAYGVAHAGKLMLWVAGDLFFALFLTEICDLSPTLMGVCLGVSMLANAAADIFVGFKFAKCLSSSKGAGRLQWLGSLMCGASIILFAVTPVCTLGFRAAYAGLVLCVFRVSYSLLDQPQNILMVLCTATDGERASIAALRFIFGGVARVLVATAFAPFFMGLPQSVQGDVFVVFMSTIALFSIGGAFALKATIAKETANAREQALPSEPQNILSQSALNTVSFPLSRLLAVVLISSALSSVWSKLLPYFAKFELKSASLAASVMVSLMIGTLASQFLWGPLGRRMSLIRLLVLTVLLQTIAAVAFNAMAHLGIWGATTGGLLVGAALGGVGTSLWALMASVAKEAVGGRASTVVASLFSAFSKSGHMLAYGLVALVLSPGDYRVGITVSLSMAMQASLAGSSLLIIGLIVFQIRQNRFA